MLNTICTALVLDSGVQKAPFGNPSAKVLGSPMVDPNSEREFFSPIAIARRSWLQIPWFLGQVRTGSQLF